MIYTMTYESPVGRLVLAANDDTLVGLWMEDQAYFLESVKDSLVERKNHPVLLQAQRWLDRYFAGERPEIKELPLAPQGSDFRRAVWDILCEIPYGETTTYGAISREIAKRLGRQRMSAQAIGGAVGHNPISIIIPCHRVVGTDGSLTGYAGGIEKKIRLLRHEGVDMEKLYVPRHSTTP